MDREIERRRAAAHLREARADRRLTAAVLALLTSLVIGYAIWPAGGRRPTAMLATESVPTLCMGQPGSDDACVPMRFPRPSWFDPRWGDFDGSEYWTLDRHRYSTRDLMGRRM